MSLLTLCNVSKIDRSNPLLCTIVPCWFGQDRPGTQGASLLHQSLHCGGPRTLQTVGVGLKVQVKTNIRIVICEYYLILNCMWGMKVKRLYLPLIQKHLEWFHFPSLNCYVTSMEKKTKFSGLFKMLQDDAPVSATK